MLLNICQCFILNADRFENIINYCYQILFFYKDFIKKSNLQIFIDFYAILIRNKHFAVDEIFLAGVLFLSSIKFC